MSALSDIVLPWLESEDGDGLDELLHQVEWLGSKLYGDYEPSEYESFDDRFGKWMANVNEDDDRKVLFRLLDHVFFVGRREFEALCRASYNGAIMRWIIDRTEADIAVPSVGAEIATAVSATWFCPITDSMRINAFLKLNHVEGKQHRPDWRSLAKFSNPEKVKDYMSINGLKRLVLMEDFVGSGTQIKTTVKFAATEMPDIPILLCPLISCPKGSEVGRELAKEYANVEFSPVLELGEKLFISPESEQGEPPIFASIRELTGRVKHRFTRENEAEPLGFKSTGALVVMYSNCPNNTVALVHNESGGWNALFPRIRRN